MTVSGHAEAYDGHTGRYRAELSAAFVRSTGVAPGMRVLDVGCGPGALTIALAMVVGAPAVSAVDPSEDYARACRQRVPGAEVHFGAAEALPFDHGIFAAVLAQLVVQALDDAPPAAREMRRVAVPGGVIAACVWDFRGGMPLMDAYWAAARALDPDGARDAGDDSENPWCTRDGMGSMRIRLDEHERPRRVGFSITGDRMDMRWTLTFTPEGGATRLAATAELRRKERCVSSPRCSGR